MKPTFFQFDGAVVRTLSDIRKTGGYEYESKVAIAINLMRSGIYSLEEIAEVAGIYPHTVNYLFDVLCLEARTHGETSFRMRIH